MTPNADYGASLAMLGSATHHEATALVLDELRGAERLLLTTHENSDGDALGSLLAMHAVLTQLGKNSLMYMSPDEFPLAHEYRDMTFGEDLVGAPPDDLADRLVVFLDCGNIDRMPVECLRAEGIRIVNVDHHHDNTLFGAVNLVVPDASCTAEIVHELALELGASITAEIGEALYVGLVTDTGRFMYENTTPAAHRMAAELIAAGVDVHTVSRRLFEDLPFSRVKLLERALHGVQRLDDGALTAVYLTRADFVETGALETDSEGLVDHLRAIEGTKVALLLRDLLAEDRRGHRKGSLRSTDGTVDVSRIARAMGGGGHRQAAGFSSELDPDELVWRVLAQVREQLAG